MPDTNEALKIWSALRPMIDAEIDQKTRSCVRTKKMLVKTAPNGSTIGVAEPFDTSVIQIPYSSAVADANVGDAVWVQWYFNNASTMLAISYGDGASDLSSDVSQLQVDLSSVSGNVSTLQSKLNNAAFHYFNISGNGSYTLQLSNYNHLFVFFAGYSEASKGILILSSGSSGQILSTVLSASSSPTLTASGSSGSVTLTSTYSSTTYCVAMSYHGTAPVYP